jgi:hypothetical protein
MALPGQRGRAAYTCSLEGARTLLQLSQSNLVELLAAWGKHEATGRKETGAQIDDNDPFTCADFALRYRAPLVSAILNLEPQVTMFVEFDPTESDAFMLFDGRNIDSWIQSTQNSNSSDADYFRAMVRAATPPEGPLVTSAQLQSSAPLGPIFLWDGWHRSAAWRERCKTGKLSRISGYLILTAK